MPTRFGANTRSALGSFTKGMPIPSRLKKASEFPLLSAATTLDEFV